MARRNEDDWPEDVVIDILSRLPVKGLLRFKCLKKSWCAVFQSPEFVSKHLNNYYNNSRNSSLIAKCFLNNSDYRGDPGGWLMFSPHQTSQQHQWFDLSSRARFLGPCNGIFFIYDSMGYSLWNPATKQLITLPPPPNTRLPYHMECIAVCGFGLNPASNEFKIVVILQVQKVVADFRYCPSRVLVYASSSNSWRDLGTPLQDEQWFYLEPSCYTYVHGQGMYYWLVYTDKHILVSFDMGSDSFELFQMPICWDEDSPNIQEAITTYHDSLALLLCHKDKGCVDVWVMNKRNWIKQLSVLSPVGLLFVFGIWINDWFVTATEDKPLVIWNAITGEVKQLSFHSSVDGTYMDFCKGFLTYRESLFSIKIGGDDN